MTHRKNVDRTGGRPPATETPVVIKSPSRIILYSRPKLTAISSGWNNSPSRSSRRADCRNFRNGFVKFVTAGDKRREIPFSLAHGETAAGFRILGERYLQERVIPYINEKGAHRGTVKKNRGGIFGRKTPAERRSPEERERLVTQTHDVSPRAQSSGLRYSLQLSADRRCGVRLSPQTSEKRNANAWTTNGKSDR